MLLVMVHMGQGRTVKFRDTGSSLVLQSLQMMTTGVEPLWPPCVSSLSESLASTSCHPHSSSGSRAIVPTISATGREMEKTTEVK
jgi:hypothetical protein